MLGVAEVESLALAGKSTNQFAGGCQQRAKLTKTQVTSWWQLHWKNKGANKQIEFSSHYKRKKDKKKSSDIIEEGESRLAGRVAETKLSSIFCRDIAMFCRCALSNKTPIFTILF